MLIRGTWLPTSFGKSFSLCKTFVFDDKFGRQGCVVIVVHVSASTSLMIAKQRDC